MRIDNQMISSWYDLTSTSSTNQTEAQSIQSRQARAQNAYNQNAGAAEVLEAEYVDSSNSTTQQAPVSPAQVNGQQLAAELYYLNSEEAQNQVEPPQAQQNIQAHRYQNLTTVEKPTPGRYLNIVA